MAVRPPDLPCAKGAVGERRLRDWRSTAAGNLCCRSGAQCLGCRTVLPHRATERRLVGDPADDNHTRRLISSRQLSAVNPPCPPAAVCPPFAQGGLRRAVTAESLRSQIALPRWRIELAWDCTRVPTGVGSPAPEQSGRQRIKPSASFASGGSPLGKLHSFGAGFFPSHRLARKGREGL